ncbi:hypothetical protein VOLCADRAFT_108575 [Volvox carteri f. nagariensis]|uniref:Uncharacterized protein n=1 Tax=Volvox carteri f. nagariensis TaxID=3068 RepID=D8UL22_VOLCA|nr:uncharacterized protein VOLCADRAFT_108575 [Volvox carteri f. nagariensis]EFJ39576.1 hypothetical protein VOLCADRAFT_108575 [Volvox carteri f. nagariensis]|eukprot:XP_002959360.1 hypothetical protein VOLCADRAFT_108575 [Volvox carteri f. nagariensis]
MSFRKEIRDSASGKLPDIHRATWKAKHRVFKEATRKAAIQETEMENMRRRIKATLSNPRGLWTWLRGGKPPPCWISDINAFTEHFSKVLNGAGNARQGCNEGIQFKWQDEDRVMHRQELVAWLNKDFTEGEIVSGLKAMRNIACPRAWREPRPSIIAVLGDEDGAGAGDSEGEGASILVIV